MPTLEEGFESPKRLDEARKQAPLASAAGSESAPWNPPPVRVTFSSPTLTADFMLPPAAAMRLGRVILDSMIEHLPNDKLCREQGGKD